MIKAVIFDLDGVLVDSGPFWDEAEAIVLSGVGVSFSLELAKDTIGLRTDELVAYWHNRYLSSSMKDSVTGVFLFAKISTRATIKRVH